MNTMICMQLGVAIFIQSFSIWEASSSAVGLNILIIYIYIISPLMVTGEVSTELSI